MKATNLPTTGHAVHLAARVAPSPFADMDCSRSAATLGEEAIDVRSIGCAAGPLFGASGDAPDGQSFVQRVFLQLDEREQPFVQIVMRSCRHPAINAFRRAFNWLGNGWLYLFAVVVLLLWQGSKGVRPAAAAGCAVGIAFVFYRAIKPLLRRLRPRDADPVMRLPIEPQDRYSCPSGHCMTAAAVAIPLLLSFPHLQVVIFGLGFLIAWSRIACGHHYPSDVLLGVGLGIAVSIPICSLIL